MFRITIREIDKQISALCKQRDELERQEIAAFKERARANVGRCFKVGGLYVRVVGVPQEKETMTGLIFNKYQYPALYLGYARPGLIPFYEGTLFSAAWGDGNNLLGTQYEEITPQEFNEEFERRIVKLRERISVEP